jgi:5,10-methylenetetrahydromethanopterin reductase
MDDGPGDPRAGAHAEMWLAAVPEPPRVEGVAARAEAAGWDGLALTDSQNLVADPFLAVAVAARATTTLRFMTGVTNAATRDPAALATAAATAQEYSGGRFVLGIGRGDTALFHLGRKPQPVDAFAERLAQVRAYLTGGTVDRRGFASRLQWLDRARQPAVEIDLAAAGPRVLALGARLADRVTLAVGADPERVAWAADQARTAARTAAPTNGAADTATARPVGVGPALGAYVVVGCHPDRDVARDLVRGAAAAFLHFSAMPGSTGAGLAARDRQAFADLGAAYDSRSHLRSGAAHSRGLDDGLIDRHAVVGPPDHCVERLAELVKLGVGRFVVAGPTLDADRDAAKAARQLLRREVLPAVRALRVDDDVTTEDNGRAHAAPDR